MKIRIIENNLNRIIKESIKKLLKEGYIDDVYMSDNFKRWFNGSKMVDENGKPLLLGHGTRNFGFKKFNTEFIHLAPIDDARSFSYSQRMFKYKNTVNKLADDEVIDFYNKYIKHNSEGNVYLIDEELLNLILGEYDRRIKKFSVVNVEMVNKLMFCKNLFLQYYNKYKGKLCCRYNKKPYLTDNYLSRDYKGKKRFKLWLLDSFPTIKNLRDAIIGSMFSQDRYMGNGGTYGLCARVLNPITIDCHWNTWDRIYVTSINCSAYSELFDKYCEFGWNKHPLQKGSEFVLDNESIAFLAKECGYDGVIFHNIKEGAYGNIRMKTTYILFSTKQLKSPYENSGDFGDVENLFK